MKFYKLIIFICFGFAVVIFSQDRNLENQLRLAQSYETANDFESAEKIYSQLLNSNPENYNIFKFYNDLLLKMKKYDQAIALAKNQILLSPANIDLYGDLGSNYFLRGNQDSAFAVWDRGISLDAQNPFSYRIIANYLIENRLIEKAIDILKAGNLKSDDPTVFSYDVANLYSVSMKFEEATSEYCEIIKSKPKQTNIIKNRIMSYINSNGADDVSTKVVENYYDENKDINFLDLLIDIYLRTNNFEKGLTSAIKMEEATSKNGSFLYNYALKTSRLGNHKIAAQTYQKIIDDYPNSVLISQAEIGYTREIESNLINVFTKKDEWKPLTKSNYDKNEFIKLLSAYKKLGNKYPSEKVGIEAEYRSGIIYQFYLDDYKKADSIYSDILNNVNAIEFFSEANFGLAKIELATGNLKNAESLLKKVISSKSTRVELLIEAKFTLAKTKMWQGQFSESIKTLGEVSASPNNENANDALQLLLILNTFKKDSLNLISFINADYLVEKKKYKEASEEFKKIAENKNLFILKDFAALNYAELLLLLDNYQEAIIFLEEISNCDEDNIYKDRFLYLLGASYFYGVQDDEKASITLAKIFDEFPNSFYSSKSRKIISEIKNREKDKI